MFGFKSRRRLLCENTAMREALLWYAARETWRRRGVNPKGAPRRQWKKSPAAFDRGSLANRVLTLITEPSTAALRAALAPRPKSTVPQPLAARESITTTE